MPIEVMERIYSGHWMLQSFNCKGFVEDFHRFSGMKVFTKYISIMEKGVCFMCWDTEEFERNANLLADKLLNDSAWRKRIYALFDAYSRAYFLAGERFRQLPFSDISDRDLVKELRSLTSLQHSHQILGVLVNGFPIDGKNHLSEKIRGALRDKIGNNPNFDAYWPLVTLPTRLSLRQKKDIALARLRRKMESQKTFRVLPSSDPNTFRKELEKIHGAFCWLDYLYMGPPASIEQHAEELRNPKNKEHLHLKRELKKREYQQIRLMDKLRLDKKTREFLHIAKQVIGQKGWRKDYQAHGFWCWQPFFEELAQRKRVADWRTLLFLFPWELEGFLLRTRPSVAELKERKKLSVSVSTEHSHHLLVGKKAREIARSILNQKAGGGVKEAKGQCAYAGKARRFVRIIHTPADMQKMKKGDIIVSQATSPDLLPAMTKAAAIVTNTGGLICHAAITSRELKIPCIVGTGNATLIFKYGDLVEVHATKGIITLIERGGSRKTI